MLIHSTNSSYLRLVLNSKTDILDVSDAPLSSCQEHYDQGDRIDGVYTIQVGNIANIILTFIN